MLGEGVAVITSGFGVIAPLGFTESQLAPETVAEKFAFCPLA
jgi:hypothetical protein